MKGEFEKADMTRFSNVLDLNGSFIFYSAQVECEQKGGGLRKPSSMPVEDDISTFRNYLLDEIEKQMNQYEMWDKHNFVKVRNLVLSRLIMFNARRGGEPARLTVNEWREATLLWKNT
ncbi:histone-lysine N-methyltransferase setd8-a [Plakobranchus ocellatus]|uniref:Histone-lysine N-methyltransferase setd8-a n=1 Tax=Plakobranchus ocellatus TaxID=259542 RepID=A0AAV4CTL1_9GAST|nr:histone-lysine N-methyltransferase setd8-a [Plakobranchus ocellatus]